MIDDLVKRLREDQPVTQDMASTMQCALQDAAANRIEELEAKLAKAVEIGDKMAASIEGNYYLPGVATDWRKLTGGIDE